MAKKKSTKYPEAVPAELKDIIQHVPEKERTLFVAKFVSNISYMPPPSVLKQYEDLLPGSADRFFKLLEKEQKIREHNVVESHKNFRLGMTFGFLSILILILSAVCAALIFDNNTLAIAILTATAVTSIVGSFTGNKN